MEQRADAVWEELPSIVEPIFGIDERPERWWETVLYGWQHTLVDISPFVLPLAVAAAISLFGFDSGAALATVVGVLVEVPVMLSVVKIVNRSKGWYERGSPALAD